MRAEMDLEWAEDLSDDSPDLKLACEIQRHELLWAQRRLEELRRRLGEEGGPPTLMRLRLEVAENRWEQAAETWERIPPMSEPSHILERMLLGARIAQTRGYVDRAAQLRQEAEVLASRWMEALPVGRRSTFADRLRLLGIDVSVECSVPPITRRLLRTRRERSTVPRELRVVAELLKRMHAERRLQPLLDMVLDSILGLTGSALGCLVVLEGDRAEGRSVRHAPGAPPSEDELIFARAAAESVAKSGRGFLSVHAPAEESLRAFGDPLSLRIGSVLVLPLRLQSGVVGSLYLHTRVDQRGLSTSDAEVAGAFADQAALAVERAALLDRSVRDPVTSLFNHAYFEDVLGVEVERCLRHGRPCALLMIDLDRFKEINDNHGHDFGTRVIREVSLVIEGAVRSHDLIGRRPKNEQGVVARFGGDEFEVVLPETAKEEALGIAQRIHDRVRRRAFRHEGVAVPVGLSIGVAAVPEDTRDVRELILFADEALYDAKHAGRGRICAYQPKGEAAARQDADLDLLGSHPIGQAVLARMRSAIEGASESSEVLPVLLRILAEASGASRAAVFSCVVDRPAVVVCSIPPGPWAREDVAADVAVQDGVQVEESAPPAKPGAEGRESDAPHRVRFSVPLREDQRVLFVLEREDAPLAPGEIGKEVMGAIARRFADVLRTCRAIEEKHREIRNLRAQLERDLKDPRTRRAPREV